MCECGGALVECVCGARCCTHCGCRGPVGVDLPTTQQEAAGGHPLPDYVHTMMADDQAEILRLRAEVERLTSERAGWVARACNAEIRLCDGCSEPNRCGSECPAASPTPTGPETCRDCHQPRRDHIGGAGSGPGCIGFLGPATPEPTKGTP